MFDKPRFASIDPFVTFLALPKFNIWYFLIGLSFSQLIAETTESSFSIMWSKIAVTFAAAHNVSRPVLTT